ncbi:hypothetical protein ACFQJ5_07270 [Halomicroarcula sp. GCM10025324]|uniref:DUF7266 family protein n=1 Tax=Haloarcula TaxID=2237 RepID=UPI0023E82C0A|nr:hypothetical protein [Halomicroarcula sp. ZS-22-S1]
MDSRAVSPVVEKLLALGIIVLYVGLLTTTLYGGTLPAYRAAVGTELGERTLAEATARVEQAVPPEARAGSARYRVDLPSTIGGAAYEIRTDGRTLVLVHPDPAVGGRTRPVLPDRVDALTGTWESGAETVVTVTGPPGELTVELEER